MQQNTSLILIMAAGTGGHVFPALSIALSLQQRGAEVAWLGTPAGMENDILSTTGIPMHRVTVKGLRGTGAKRKLMAPFMMAVALWQSWRVLREVRPDCVLGMGGFVCGPAGIAARLMGLPLLVHEQNAVAGLTNRLLAHVATQVLEAFPGTFKSASKVKYTGNPVREEIVATAVARKVPAGGRLRLLVLGGSQGAEAINRVIPEVLASWSEDRPETWHQTGRRGFGSTVQRYADLQLGDNEGCRITPFIDDMAAAFAWADLVVCRSGASTVAELAVAGLPSVLVPYPHHRDRQQYFNADWLVAAGAARCLDQKQLDASSLLALLRELDGNRDVLMQMSEQAGSVAIRDAAAAIADHCLEVAHGR